MPPIGTPSFNKANVFCISHNIVLFSTLESNELPITTKRIIPCSSSVNNSCKSVFYDLTILEQMHDTNLLILKLGAIECRYLGSRQNTNTFDNRIHSFSYVEMFYNVFIKALTIFGFSNGGVPNNFSSRMTTARFSANIKKSRNLNRLELTLNKEDLLDSFTSFSCLDNLHSDALASRIWSGNRTPDADDVDGRHLSSLSDLGMTATSDGVKQKCVVELSTVISARTVRLCHYHTKKAWYNDTVAPVGNSPLKTCTKVSTVKKSKLLRLRLYDNHTSVLTPGKKIATAVDPFSLTVISVTRCKRSRKPYDRSDACTTVLPRDTSVVWTARHVPLPSECDVANWLPQQLQESKVVDTIHESRRLTHAIAD
ncbi:hypothetical protein AGLY_014158 [Aphis glycines]|uniref:Uncharacterized protein n=1 Tax=Aphis glycines TaxID=307491 RepID=A0A6G0T495_APHGL|nr:hypothetical protein AGLY_014158 [Aphis glycines]